ncbi:MAG TPA: tripartite tricarboxylate transporter substrate-binding protein, partial [Candidatus Limnocylindrales bacterium]|nr:tripartite tricarboxylate transporter substrate-binding protein [Candidatus Limnocylindrales bacterium]
SPASPAPTTGSPAASEAAGPSPAAYPAGTLRILAPASPGGGWDSTARAIQKVIDEAGLTTENVEVYNVPGAGGTIGLAQFVEQEKGDPNSLMVMGLVMVGAIETNASPVDLSSVTPIARLTSESEAIAVKADSKYQTLADLIADFKANPTSVSWGGGSAGGTDHILVGLVAKAAGVEPGGINYIAHSGGGEALDAILSGAVTAGVSSASEFADQVAAGNMRILAVSSAQRIPGVDAPTITEAGLDVVLDNWRGIVAPPEIGPEERDAIVAFITRLHDSPEWQATLEANGWTDDFAAGDEFAAFLAEQQTTVEGVLREIGLVQ